MIEAHFNHVLMCLGLHDLGALHQAAIARAHFETWLSF